MAIQSGEMALKNKEKDKTKRRLQVNHQDLIQIFRYLAIFGNKSTMLLIGLGGELYVKTDLATWRATGKLNVYFF